MDAAYRSDLKETNDLNRQRFKEGNDLSWQRFKENNDLSWERFKDYMDARLDSGLNGLRADLMKWMFIYWVGSVMTTAGLILGVLRFSPR